MQDVAAATLAPAERARKLLNDAHALIAEASAALAETQPPVVPPSGSSGTSEHGVGSGLVAIIELTEQIAAAGRGILARASIAYRDAIIAAQQEAGVEDKDLGRGVAEEIGMARRISPRSAAAQLELQEVVARSMPRTFDLLESGEIGPWAADEIARAAIVLGDEDRAQLDAELATRFPDLTPMRAGAVARARADELDPGSVTARTDRETSRRRVSIRAMSDIMSRVAIDLPTPQAAGIIGALDATARTIRATDGERTIRQIMADEAFCRLTGLQKVDDAAVEIQLIMTDAALLADSDDAASLDGHPIPAAVARRLALGAPGPGTESGDAGSHGSSDDETQRAGERFVRRLYTDPRTGSLRDADRRRRRFRGIERRFIALRDQRCRAPWCDAPIDHLHHVERFADGGETIIENGVGTCESFNLALEMPGWHTRAAPDGTLEVTTPGGLVRRSSPPILAEARPGARRATTATQARAPSDSS